MERLIESGLFGRGLTRIDTPELVQRYNSCLERLGIQPTELKSFQIDGIGWSPEITSEKKDHFYLGAGVANPMAIVLSPAQEGKPVYFPFNSYDEPLIQAYFSRFREEIADITSSTGLALEIDDGLTSYENPADLFLVDYVTVRSLAGTWVEEAVRQQDLAQRFMKEDSAWQDPRLMLELLDSAKRCGDLRSRRVSIPEMRYDDLRFFYTAAFDGAFVLKGLSGGKRLVVLNRDARAKTKAKDPCYIDCGPKVIDILFEEGLVEIDFSAYAEQPARLARKRECLVADILSQTNPDADIPSLSEAQRRKALVELGSSVPKSLHELERLIRCLISKGTMERADLSIELQTLLMHPRQDLPRAEERLIARLLVHLDSRDVVELFRHDRSLFYDLYLTWPQAKRRWAIYTVKNSAAALPYGGL